MDKRLLLALSLSFLVVFGWSILYPPPPPSPANVSQVEGDANGSSTTGADAPAGQGGAKAASLPTPETVVTEEQTHAIVVGRNGEPGHYRMVFTNRGARLLELRLGEYYERVGLDEAQRADHLNWLKLVESIEGPDGPTGSFELEVGPSSRPLAPGGLSEVLWELEPREDGAIFRYAPGTGVRFEKRILVEPETWHLRFELVIENTGAGALGRREFLLSPAGVVRAELGDSFYPEPRAVAVGFDPDDEEFEHDSVMAAQADPTGEGLDVPVPAAFVGVHNKYFAFFLRPSDPADAASLSSARARKIEPVTPVLGENGELDFVEVQAALTLDLPAEGESRTWRYTVYAGPKEREQLKTDFPAHAGALEDDLGFFSGISNVLLSVMGFFHRLTGNWGWSIILLTICVRLVLFPMNRRSQTAMARYQKKMKRVQPKLDKIKKDYANDPQKQREAQAKLMQEERAFPPLGGCLPMFLQIPVFFGLFSALRTSFDLRHAPFMGWINDLSRPDRLLELNLEIPLGFTTLDVRWFNLLPILMVITWVLQQMGMPKPSDEQQAKMQKMMMFMPVMFGFFLYNYASGLSLYMITQSTLGILEQRVIKKVWPVDDTEPDPKKPAGCGPFSGAMQNFVEKQREQMERMEEMKRQQSRGGKQTKKRKKRL